MNDSRKDSVLDSDSFDLGEKYIEDNHFMAEKTSKVFQDEQLLENTDIEREYEQKKTTLGQLKYLEHKRRKGFFARNLASFDEGGIKSSVFTLFTGTLGAGVLLLPHLVGFFGLGFGSLFVLVAALLNHKSYLLLNEGIIKSRKNTYSNLCSYYLGKYPALIFTYFLFFSNFMYCVLYATLSWDFLERLLKKMIKFHIRETDQVPVILFDDFDISMPYIRMMSMLVLATFILYFTTKRDLSSSRFRMISVIILFTIITTLAVTVRQLPDFVEYYSIMKNYEVEWFNTDFSPHWITGFASISLIFGCQPAFFFLRSQMKSKTEKRIKKIVQTTVTFQVIIFLVAAATGYFSFGKNMIPDIYILREPIPAMSDVFMSILQWVFVVITVMHIPIFLFSTREMFFTFFRLKKSSFNIVLVSIFLTFLSFFVPVVYPDVISIIGIIAGIFAFTINIVFPFLIGYRIRKREGRKARYFYGVIIAFSIFISLSSTIISIAGYSH